MSTRSALLLFLALYAVAYADVVSRGGDPLTAAFGTAAVIFTVAAVRVAIALRFGR